MRAVQAALVEIGSYGARPIALQTRVAGGVAARGVAPVVETVWVVDIRKAHPSTVALGKMVVHVPACTPATSSSSTPVAVEADLPRTTVQAA